MQILSSVCILSRDIGLWLLCKDCIPKRPNSPILSFFFVRSKAARFEIPVRAANTHHLFCNCLFICLFVYFFILILNRSKLAHLPSYPSTQPATRFIQLPRQPASQPAIHSFCQLRTVSTMPHHPYSHPLTQPDSHHARYLSTNTP